MILFSVDLKSRGFSFSLVGASCIFSALWVGIGNGIHKSYEEPTPVCRFSKTSHPSTITDSMTSFGVGSTRSLWGNAWLENMSGFGSHYLLR
jgi:hypothetical protein